MSRNISELTDLLEKNLSLISNFLTEINQEFRIEKEIGEGYGSSKYLERFMKPIEPLSTQSTQGRLRLPLVNHFHLSPIHFDDEGYRRSRCRFYLNEVPDEYTERTLNVTLEGPGGSFVRGGTKKSIYISDYDYKRVHKGISFSICILLVNTQLTTSDFWNPIETVFNGFVNEVQSYIGGDTVSNIVRRVSFYDRHNNRCLLLKIVNLDTKSSKK